MTLDLSPRRAPFKLNRRGFLHGSALVGIAAASGILGGPASAQEPKRGGTLRLGLDGGSTADTLDPAIAAATFAFVLCHCWGDTLVESASGDRRGASSLAESWDVSDDGITWTFQIREGVEFHDGKPLTVEDVVETLRRHADESSQSGALGLIGDIERIEGEGRRTRHHARAKPNADLPLVLTDYHLQIQPGGGRDDPNAAIGTGPFKLTNFTPGVRATFEKNANDWRDDRGFVDSVEITVMNDATARNSALTSGQVDFINTVDPKTAAFLGRAPNVEILRTAGKGFYSFLMHCDTAPFDNNDLRLALKYAIDREAILQAGSSAASARSATTIRSTRTTRSRRPISSSAPTIQTRPPSTSSSPAMTGRSCCAPPRRRFPAPSMRRSFSSKARPQGRHPDRRAARADDGYWSEVWNVQPFCASYWGGRPTQDARYSTSYVSNAEWNDTRFKRPDFDKMVRRRAPSSTRPSAGRSIATWR